MITLQMGRRATIDWINVEAYVSDRIAGVRREMWEKLGFLETMAPIVSVGSFPPKIMVDLCQRDNLSVFAFYRAFESPQEREYKKNEKRIAKVISEVAKNHDLKASLLFDEGDRKYILGRYLLKPVYSVFEVKA